MEILIGFVCFEPFTPKSLSFDLLGARLRLFMYFNDGDGALSWGEVMGTLFNAWELCEMCGSFE